MKQQKFEAILVKDPEAGGWTKIGIPFDVEKVFGAKGYVQVKGSIDDEPFAKIKIMPVGDGTHQMAVSEKLRKAIKKGDRDLVSIIMEADPEEVLYKEPQDFLKALSLHKTARRFYETLTSASKK